MPDRRRLPETLPERDSARKEFIMRIHLLVKASIAAAIGLTGLCHAQDDNALKLWYKQPAQQWTQALPVGNGRLAAMVFGDFRKEHIQLNEDTIWSGEKRSEERRVGKECRSRW